MERTDIEFQELAGKLVEAHVYACVTSMVIFILAQEGRAAADELPFSRDDIENYYTFPENVYYLDGEAVIRAHNEEAVFTLQDMREEEEELTKSFVDGVRDQLIKEGVLAEHDTLYASKEAAQEEEAAQEIYEWWIVSDVLAKKLCGLGHPIIKGGMGSPYLWGRCCTGQAIKLDGDIQHIAQQWYGPAEGKP